MGTLGHSTDERKAMLSLGGEPKVAPKALPFLAWRREPKQTEGLKLALRAWYHFLLGGRISTQFE